MKRILVTNDDGVYSDGIKALADAMQALGEVTVVAPLAEASAIGHALTLRTLLNINVPQGKTKGFKVTVQARRNHVTKVDERVDPRGQRYFWIEEGQNEWEPHDRSDFQAVRDGYISVTPLQPDLTAFNLIPTIEEFLLQLPAGR